MLTKVRSFFYIGIAVLAVGFFILPKIDPSTHKKDNRVRVIWKVKYDHQAGGVYLHWLATDGQQGEKTVTYSPFNNADKPLFVARGTTVTLYVYSFQGTSKNANKSCEMFFDDVPKGGSVHTQGMTDLKCEGTA